VVEALPRLGFYRPMEHNAAVIFDVDGPLLELTDKESAAFFVPFRDEYGLTGLSDDWDSYPLRNDVEIYRDVLRSANLPHDDAVIDQLRLQYLRELDALYAGGDDVVPIRGAYDLLQTLSSADGLALGTATANFEAAAEKRLRRTVMWDFVRDWHSGAEGGGAKRDILARVIARLGLPAEKIVFLGDNLNDLDAAQTNGTHFIGFHTEERRRDRLQKAGAETVTGDHDEVLKTVKSWLTLG